MLAVWNVKTNNISCMAKAQKNERCKCVDQVFHSIVFFDLFINDSQYMASDELHSPVKLMTIKNVICMAKNGLFYLNSFNYFA